MMNRVDVSTPTFHIRPATSPKDLIYTKELFRAYASALPIDLSFQNFAHELASLPGKYAHPTGVIFLAFLGPDPTSPVSNPPENQPEVEPIGVIALRPLPSSLMTSTGKTCEIKRLYLTPASRGLGIGKVLVDTVISEAKGLGYEEVRLDTLTSMVSAKKLYKQAGFEEVGKYYDSPIEGTVFLGRSL